MGFKLDDIKHLLPAKTLASMEAGRKAQRRMFGNTPTTYNGVRYDSKTEAARAAQLDVLQAAGAVRWWLDQVRFRLGTAECTYRADFLVCMKDGSIHAEDIKGRETEKFRFIKKMWQAHGVMPLWIIRDGNTEIVEGGKSA